MTQSEKLERKPCAVQPLPSLDLSVTSMAFCPLYGDDLDAAILSKLRPHFLKVAKVISDVVRAFDEQGLSIDAETISARIRLLADIDRIEGVGDLRKWRFSEVRLKD
jgi:hypothetical protein